MNKIELKSPRKTQQIVEYLIELIISKKVPTNKIMPSEHALMMRFNCSRSVVVSAYNKLEALGAVYTISKRGHFVAENFHNLIKPISFLIGADTEETILKSESDLEEWNDDNHIIFLDGYYGFDKKFFIKKKMVGDGVVYVSKKHLPDPKMMEGNKALINFLIDKKVISNIVYQLCYEKVKKYGRSELVAIKMFGYDDDSICIAGKFYIDPDHFKFFHQEFSLTW
ncbi:winged helix-turn-helix domain-containing protein [Mycoplasmopsis ciconiae]|uniref:Winged helix-turn-helix domain-containing protein n=1 Tax=Mycoplasmopsis ciconiae TaxID=561067 RepID=A0ABU7MM88_9BACT|nr:winged helix-turn-helix domain-containing protein [Mycoplasmopsis ciconiae]